MNHLTDPVTGEADPSCICAACVTAAVERIWAAEQAVVEKRALNRMLADMAKMPRVNRRGRRDWATCERLREYFND